MANDMNDGTASLTLGELSNMLTNDTVTFKDPSFLFGVQDHSLSDRASHVPLSKQFIPVAVLAAILLIFFASHLLRFPRILHILPLVRASSGQENPRYQQRRKYILSKAVIPYPRSFLRIPLSRSNGSKVLSSRDVSTFYSTPTVRLVHGYINRSPEPRVYLPQEITLPNSSPTLVGSSSSDFSTPIAEVHIIPPRVYLSPTLPEVFDYEPLSPALDTLLQDACGPASTGIQISDMRSEQQLQHPALTSSPIPASAGLNNLFNKSSDMHILSFSDLYTSEVLVPDACKPKDDPSSSELVTPPIAFAHPILARRALFPWRYRSPPEASYEDGPAKTTAIPDNVDPRRLHRPSIPSRLRYFITRSTTASLSSSHTRSTPESSLGKRSEKSSTASKPSPVGRYNERSSLSEAESHVEGDASQRPSFPTALLGRAPSPENDAPFDTQTQDTDLAPSILSEDSHSDRPGFFEISSPPETSDGMPESPEQRKSDAEEAGEDIFDLHEERASAEWSPSSESARGASTASRALFGLGFRVMSDYLPVTVPAISRPPSVFGSSTTTTEMWWKEKSVAGPEVHPNRLPENDHGALKDHMLTGLSLRTVFARWMTGRRENITKDIIGEEGTSVRIDSQSVASDSVEIMVMDRWASVV